MDPEKQEVKRRKSITKKGNGVGQVQKELRLGIDVGSTTVKLVIADQRNNEMLYSCYRRHHARQVEAVAGLLKEARERYPDEVFRTAVCGSGGKPIAKSLQVHFIQEVVANAAAVCALYPQARTAVELGGQDAKVIFFYYDDKSGKLQASDMRMNGSCAGGTGAFIDEIAALLNIETADFEKLAAKGNTVFDISGRCGVFAKTDIQPLLIQGAAREDIALSSFHAIAKQTIGGLSQGLELKAPVIFEGGPLTFNPTLIRVFAKRLEFREQDIIVPEHPETIVAFGTALAIDQLFSSDGQQSEKITLEVLEKRLEDNRNNPSQTAENTGKPLFSDKQAREAFEARHKKEIHSPEMPLIKDGVLRVYLGIDSGSTTSKFVLLDENERVIDRYYANNHGEPLRVVCDGMVKLCDKYEKTGTKLEVLGLGTTGYGELLFAKAFNADLHIVETVAHSQGCLKFFPDATFILDIGGQDMKAVWLDNGIITNIMLNEACSSGCGSFMENFALTLGIAVENIAEAAFQSKTPASLGSRCTVFMNSTIINEQRNGKMPNDIMAGVCRSIIENVFTKVVRISNTDDLGEKVVVQGGTFRNGAVLRALEEYLGREVALAPYPGEMGALGAALLAKRHIEEYGYANDVSTSFIGLEAVRTFDYVTQTGVACPLCANHCNRNIMRFSTGKTWVTGNRCERGTLVADDEKKSGKRKHPKELQKEAPDMFAEREAILFKEYPCNPVSERKNQTVGLPRVLEFWDSMPFWSTFFRALGYDTAFSHKSSQKLYEQGLTFVASDTVCFPAKLVHGHIMDLAEQKVDRIFMPYVMHMPPEGKDKLSPYVCSIIMGYSMVVRNSQSPETRYNIVFDTPVFHWFTEKNRNQQICEYAVKTLHVSEKEVQGAFLQAVSAISAFRGELTGKALAIMDNAKQNHTFAVVLAGRPYHTDSFVSHNISKLFTKKGIPVLTVDSLPGLNEVDLHNTRIEVTNNFHTRMLSGAMIAAGSDALEYVQLVSFGCGHDAVLSDEIIRIMTENGKKSPLILKIDESDASGSLGIRVQSFIETVRIRRKINDRSGDSRKIPFQLPVPSPVKFYKKDKKQRTLLIPNISAEVSKLFCGVLEKEHFSVKSIPVGSTEQIKLGKKYVHNDICFPCQMVIGELIAELNTGKYKQDEVVVEMIKFQCDCRLSHYAGLLRKGLDSAGFQNVPIMTTDVNDTKDMHPGVSLLGINVVLQAVWSFMMLDILTELCRKIRPYEIIHGETDRVYGNCVDKIAEAIKKGIKRARAAFEECMDDMGNIAYNRDHLKPRVLVTGELLVTYHPGSNFDIEKYLERNGMETIFPRITDQLRKDFLASMCQIKEYHANISKFPFAVNYLFDTIQEKLEKTAIRHPLYEKALRPRDVYKGVRDIIPETLSCGEGWLMAAEIAHFAKQGVKSFVILQPFGCLPNHICGRGVIKRLKDEYPEIQILPLDLDPDTSFTNVENRLQMLIMNKNREIQ